MTFAVLLNCRNDKLHRPPVPPLDPLEDALVFQELELDNYLSSPYPGMPGAQTGLTPVMRLFGVTKGGNSVCCHIHGFSPYFYVNLPHDFPAADIHKFKVSI